MTNSEYGGRDMLSTQPCGCLFDEYQVLITCNEHSKEREFGEYWRFEPDTYLMQALEAHYDHPDGLPGDPFHSDAYACARYILEWLEEVNVELVYRGPG